MGFPSGWLIGFSLWWPISLVSTTIGERRDEGERSVDVVEQRDKSEFKRER